MNEFMKGLPLTFKKRLDFGLQKVFGFCAQNHFESRAKNSKSY